jgi:hypothetical protein
MRGLAQTGVVMASLLVGCGGAADAPRPDAAMSRDAAPVIDAAVDATIDGAPDAPPAIDEDHDGHPAGTDCDDHDPAVWRPLPYSFRDADGDGHTVAASGMICSGEQLPPGYLQQPGEPDCNDSDPAVFTQVIGFRDPDGDDHGEGMPMSFCTSGELPAGFGRFNGDCAPSDPARWQVLPYSFRDADGDGAVVREDALVCSGATLPLGYFDALASRWAASMTTTTTQRSSRSTMTSST